MRLLGRSLTAGERDTINYHIVATIKMLEQLPWPKHLKNVPEYAGGHHERMDGNGYPRGLFAGDMSIPARVLAIADEYVTVRNGRFVVPVRAQSAKEIDEVRNIPVSESETSERRSSKRMTARVPCVSTTESSVPNDTTTVVSGRTWIFVTLPTSLVGEYWPLVSP